VSPWAKAVSLAFEGAKNYINSKNYLSEKGIDLNFIYTGDAVLDYGLKYMGNFDFKISFDFEKSLN